ncbi:hypothetical protein [Streptomyces virginiae]|uniref:hypothetical protein n=1 Tax=Streptomyces virginiae TaxID=1961 RepID=UPI003653097E
MDFRTHRAHRTVRRLAPLFGISPATVCRVVERLRPSLAAEPAPLPVAGVDRSWIVDGSYLGTGPVLPHRRRAGRPFPRGQDEDDAAAPWSHVGSGSCPCTGSPTGDISACRRCNRVRARPDRQRPGSRPTCPP